MVGRKTDSGLNFVVLDINVLLSEFEKKSNNDAMLFIWIFILPYNALLPEKKSTNITKIVP